MAQREKTRQGGGVSNRLRQSNEVVSLVSYRREILVKHPTIQFENQRFCVELTDSRWAGESYQTVKDRLKKQVDAMLLDDVEEFLHGAKVRQEVDQRAKLARQYNLEFVDYRS